MTQPLVSIISVHFNEPEATQEMLTSLRSCRYSNKEIIVVDNGSTKGNIQELVNEFQEVLFLKSNKNLGFAGGNNLALPFIKGEYVFFLNNDATVYPDTLEKLIGFLEDTPQAGIVSPLIYFPLQTDEEKNRIQFVGTTSVHPITGRNTSIAKYGFDFDQFREPKEIPYPHGAAMLVRKKMIDQIGSMSEDFFLYYEELDWACRANKAGWKTFLFPEAKVIHQESLSTGADSAFKTYYLDRSRILFMQRNFGSGSFALFLTYYLGLVFPKDILKNLVNGRADVIKAKWQAIIWNLKHLFEKQQIVTPSNVTITALLPLSKSFHFKTNVE